MTLMQTHHFCTPKSLLLITLICQIILIGYIAQLLLIRKFYCFHKGPHISFKYAQYNTQWWEKHLLKRSPLKHTCSWCDNLIVLWILNRQAKIFLHTSKLLFCKRIFFRKHSILDFWQTSEYASAICYSLFGKYWDAIKIDLILFILKFKHNYHVLCLSKTIIIET